MSDRCTLSDRWTFFLLILVGAMTLSPLLQVGFVVNDDLKFSNAALAGGLPMFFSTMWNLTRLYGRMHFLKVFSYYLPFAVDSFVYFKAVTLAAVVADLLIFAYFLQLLFDSKRAFFLGLLLSLVGLQLSWEHSAMVAFAGQHTFSLLYLLLSFISYLYYLRGEKKRWLYASVVLYILVLFPYEMFVIYAPVYFMLGLHQKKGLGEALRKMIPHLLSVAAFLVAFLVFYHLRVRDYTGTTVSPEFHPGRILRVIWQFSISAMPGYFLFDPKYRYIIRQFRDNAGSTSLFYALKALWLVKACLVGVLFWTLTSSAEGPSRFKISRTFGVLLLVGVAYFFAPALLLALTAHYQQAVVEGGQLGMQVTYYSYFALLWVAVLVLAVLSAPFTKLRMGRVMLAVVTSLLILVSLGVDYTNYHVAKSQADARARWRLVDEFLKSPSYAAVPPGAIIYAPSLAQAVGSLSFAGNAIDPPPATDPALYSNYWTFYFSHRGRKRVIVVSNPAAVSKARAGFYFISYLQEPNSSNQALVFCRILQPPTTQGSGRFLCQEAVVYDLSPRTSLLVGGRVWPTNGSEIIRVKGIDPFEATDLFILECGEPTYSWRGDLKEVVLSADNEVIDAESVFVSSGGTRRLHLAKEDLLTRLGGWYADDWVARTATARIQTRSRRRLVIAGFVPAYYFNTLHWPEVNVTVKLDDRILKVLSLKKGGDFRIQQELSANTSALLTIESDRSYVPFLVGMGKDHRELSLVITRIEVE